MKIENLTNDTIRRYIPNIMTEVGGETPISDKLAPFIESAKLWLESEYLGPDDFLSDAHNELALKILVKKAFSEALPSLDIVVTPNGLAVINTDNMAPASKDRVRRLIDSLNSSVTSLVSVLVDVCRGYESWRNGFGRKFCSVFLYEPAGVTVMPNTHYDFDFVQQSSLEIEASMAEHYLGKKLMDTLRSQYHSHSLLPGAMSLVQRIRYAIITRLSFYQRNEPGMMVRDSLWHLCRPIVNDLNYFPEYKDIWEAEMGHKFNIEGFVNNIKGGYYF